MSTKISKFNSIDLVKFVMSIFVIIIHTTNLQESSFKLFPLLLKAAVPFFFMCSGFLVMKKISVKQTDEVVIYKKYVFKILRLYITWSLVFLPITIYHFFTYEHTHSELITIIGIIKNYFFIGEQWYSYSLWYLLVTIFSYTIIGILRYLKISYKNILYIAIVLFIIGISYNVCMENIGLLPSFAKQIFNFLRHIFGSTGRNFTGLLYIMVGILYAKNSDDRVKKYLNPVLIFFLLICLFIDAEIIRAIFYILVFLKVVNIELNDSKIYHYLRETSTILYFIHMIIFFFYSLLVGFDNCKSLMGFAFTIVLSSIISTIFIYMDNKNIKIFNKLFN